MSNTFNEMKKALQNDELYNYAAVSDEYMDYVNCRYGDAADRLIKQYEDLYIEPSTQCGRGGVFATYTVDGVIYRTNWDFECECESIDEMILDCDSEEEFINALCSYIEGKLEDAEPDDDEEDEEDE